MNYQEKRVECLEVNIIVASKNKIELGDLNENTIRLVELYYKLKEKFINAYSQSKEQMVFKVSKKRIDKISFNQATFESNLAVYGELKWTLRILERGLNIKPDKPVDSACYSLNWEDITK